MIETFVLVVFCAAKLSGGVNEMLVLLVFVTIVPRALPHLYVIVSVNELFFLPILNVVHVSSVPSNAVKSETLAIVSRVKVFSPDLL